MDRNETLSDETWRFVQAILGEPTTYRSKAEADRARLEWVERVSPRPQFQLRNPQRDDVAPSPKRGQSQWDTIAEEIQSQLRDLSEVDAQIRELQDRLQRLSQDRQVREANWISAKHPRTGTAPNPGYFAPTGGEGGSGGTGKPSSFLDAVIKRNHEVAQLTGFVSPGLMQSSRLAVDLQAAGKLPAEVRRAAAAGLITGAKALANGWVTAIKSVATLGFSSSQYELIGVTKEDREHGYDHAVVIATASGEVLIALGTSGLASVLSKGGTIARTVGRALVAFDAAGNAVGVIRGLYDLKTNGVTLSNGTQIAAGLLGLGANIQAARGLKSPDLLPKGFDPVKGFATFDDFKDAFGAAGPGLAWHHIVEQTVNSGKFAAELLHNPANLLKLPHGAGTIHAKISGYYSSKIPGLTGNLTVREWLSKKSFKEQFSFGIDAIKKAGGSEYLPPDLR